MPAELNRLSPAQRDLVKRWLPGARVVADLSWEVSETIVFELASGPGRFVLKAGGSSDTHIARELRAHREWLSVWTSTGQAPALVSADEPAAILLTHFLPGRLVEGTPAQHDSGVYRQAGALLARFHNQLSAWDPAWNEAHRARAQLYLDLPHRIDPDIAQLARAEVATWPGGGARVVPTHGDWQPRNWLIDDGTVRVIDLGRAALRPPSDDFVRLARQDFARDPALETAFLEGYGPDPREPDQWRREFVGEAIGTAVWAYGVGDHAFEAFGHDALRSLYAGAL